jgi:hypothetical protein
VRFGQSTQLRRGGSLTDVTAAREHRHAESPTARRTPAKRATGGSFAARTVMRLQSGAGNTAVSRLLAKPAPAQAAVQRLDPGGGCPAPAVAPTPPAPEQDPGFRAVLGQVGAAKKATSNHPPAKSEAKAAQGAAKAPADDKEAQAKAAQAGEMEAAKPAGFDKAAFIAAVNAAIAAQAPKNLDEADKFATSGKADTIKSQVMDKVSKGKDDSAKPLAEKANATPDTSKAVEKPVTPLPGKKTDTAAPKVDAAKAMPPKAPAEQTELGAGRCETDSKMADAGVTEQQLTNSNEPQFQGAVAAKKEGEEHSAAAPAQVRQAEDQHLTAAQAGAQGSAGAATAAMAGARGNALGGAVGRQGAAQTADEAKRAEVSGRIKGIFDKTKVDVDKILADLDGKVTTAFEAGEREAKTAFTTEHTTRMEKYKDDRYSGVTGWARWTADLFTGLPAEANQIYLEAKKVYEAKMQVVIGQVADLVGGELARAKARVAEGRAEIQKYVAGLPRDLQSVGKDAAKEIGDQFDSLDAAVEEKGQALAEDLASKYVEARNAVDEEIKTMQEANKGLWDKAKDAVAGAIETILKLKDMLLGVLARAAGAVEKIIKDPIGFLEKFINAVKTGVINFGSNILEHLKKGLQGWLFGALAEAGIEIPDTFDLKGIIKLILSLLGLTWNAIRARILKFVPEPVMAFIEKSVDFVQAIISEGVVGLWKWIAAKLSDLKEMVLSKIEDFVVTKVITAGITWLISLLNPAAAFIKACKMIYDAVMWFVDNAARLKEFVDSILDSVESIASGGVGAVANYIEQTLAKAVPMVISGLASLLGLGGIADKIKNILETVQKPVMKVVDKLVGTAVKFGKKMLGKLRQKKDTRSPEQRKAALDTAMASGQAILADKSLNEKGLKAKLASIKQSHKVKKLDLAIDSKSAASEQVHIVGANSPTIHGPAVTRTIYTPFVQKTDESAEIAAVGPLATLIVEGEDVGVWQVDDKRIRVSFDATEAGAVIHTGATPARALADIMAGLKMDREDAKKLLDALGQAKLMKPSEARALLHQYARTKAAGGLDPLTFLRDKLRRGHGTAAAFAKPPGYERRQAGVELGQTEEGKQRATLSNYAQVFYEKEVGQWKSRQVQPKPEQGENTSIEYIWQPEGSPVVMSLGIVQVDEDGTIVDVIEVQEANVPGGRAKLIEIMKTAGWRVQVKP